METVVEQIIKKRSYGSLSEEERNAVKEWCGSEEEFVQMKQFLGEVEVIAASSRIEPGIEIKNSLDTIFASKHGGIRAAWTSPAEAAPVPVQAPVIPLYQRTWVRAAAVAVIVLGTVPFWNLAGHKIDSAEKQPLAKLETPELKDVPSEVKTREKTTENRSVASAEILPAPSVSDESAGISYEWNEADSKAASFKSSGTVVQGSDGEAMDQATNETMVTASWSKEMSAGSATAQPSYSATTYTYATAGMNADLNPYSVKKNSNDPVAISMAAQPDDLLDFIVPAF